MQARDQWQSRIGFIFATVGAAVGLGNLWRFPFMAYENGGGAFLIPYFVALLTAGVPLMIMEFGFGHKMRSGAISAFRQLGRRYEFIGWWQILIPIVVVTYYSVIISWAVNYLVFSVTQAWGQDPIAFFGGQFLGVSAGPFDLGGGYRWPILLGTAAVWIVNYLITSRGVSAGIEKASRFMTPVLAFLLLLVAIRGLTLPGAGYGLNFLLNPDFSKILDPQVWVAAYSQVFFSTTVAVGVMIAYASYLPKKADLVNNAFLTVFCNAGFDFLAGLAVFSTLGYTAMALNVPFTEIAVSGAGIAFAAFPQAISVLPMPAWGQSLFGMAFFLGLTVAGISSSISMFESFASAVIDRTGIPRRTLLRWFSVIGFALSSLYATGAGVHILDIVDHFVGSYGIALLGLIEAIVLGWVYGAERMRSYVNLSSDFPAGRWWDATIKYVTPALLGYTVITSLANEFRRPYGDYPMAAVVLLGWGVATGMLVVALYLSRRSAVLYSSEGGE